MNIQYFIEQEPRLLNVIQIAKYKNQKQKNMYWHSFWCEIKGNLYELVGTGAKSEKLNSCIHWDFMHDYLRCICTNFK